MKKSIIFSFYFILIGQLMSCGILLKNASAPQAFNQAKKKDAKYVAEEGGKEHELKLEKE